MLHCIQIMYSNDFPDKNRNNYRCTFFNKILIKNENLGLIEC